MAEPGTNVVAPPTTTAPRGSDRPLAGLAWMALGVSTLPLMDAIAKYLSAEYHVLQVTWARYGFHLLLLVALLAWRLRPAELIPRHPGLQVLRSGFLLGTTLCYFGAISFLPLANVLALAFIGPIVSTALSPVALGEHVGPRRWTAVLTLALPAVWQAPTPAAWAWMAAMGLFGALAHFFIIRAFEHATAPVLAPVSYVEIVAAATIGWLVFGDFPDGWTWAGVAVIVASGIYISIREGRGRARR